MEHYRFLAREVDIVGSDKTEHIEIQRIENGDVLVEMFKVSKTGERGNSFYRRLFKESETKEVRIFAMSGDDVRLMRSMYRAMIESPQKILSSRFATRRNRS